MQFFHSLYLANRRDRETALPHFPLFQSDMKTLAYILPTFLIALLLSILPMEAGAAVLKRVTSQHLKGGRDVISILFEGRSKPKIFSLGGNLPRLVFDFAGARYSGPPKIAVDGALVKAVRIATHQNPLKTRVVFDLLPGRAVDYKEEFLEGSQTLRISLSGKGEKPAAAPSAPKPVTTSAKTEQPVTARPPVQEKTPAPPPAKAPTVPAKASETASPFGAPLLIKKQPAKAADSATPDGMATRVLSYSLVALPTGGDVLRLQLDGYASPKITAREGRTPKIVCFFPQMRLAVKKKLKQPLSGKFIQKVAVSAQKEPAGVQMVLDLEAGYDYDIRQVFVKDESVFELLVNVFKR